LLKLDDWIAKRSQTSPRREAVTTAEGTLTYAELEARATAAARALAAHGVRRGQAAALALSPGLDFAVAAHGLLKLGAIIVPLHPDLPEAERARSASLAEAEHLITDPSWLSGPEADLPLLGEHDLSDPLCRIFTSGTSGEPRAVELTYGNILWSAVGSAFNLGVDPEDRWLCCMPLAHVGGLSILLRSAIYGTAAVIHEGFDAERIADSFDREGVSVLSLVATTLNRLLAAGAPIERARVVLVGGGPVPEAVLEEAADRGAAVVQTYGLTEAASQVTALPPGDARRKLGSAGRQLLTTHLRIGDGEILVQGPTVSPGCLDEDGWLRTGDTGWIDDEGFLYVSGRRGDLIVTGGENVAPAEVESVLLGHPAVADAAVVGRPDAEWQEAVTAMVVLREGARVAGEDLRSFCRGRLASFKVPKSVEFVSLLPRNEAGKLLRRQLR